MKPYTEFARCQPSKDGDGYASVCNGCRRVRRYFKRVYGTSTGCSDRLKAINK